MAHLVGPPNATLGSVPGVEEIQYEGRHVTDVPQTFRGRGHEFPGRAGRETQSRVFCVSNAHVLDVAVIADDEHERLRWTRVQNAGQESVDTLQGRHGIAHLTSVTGCVRGVVGPYRQVVLLSDASEVPTGGRWRHVRQAGMAQVVAPPVVDDLARYGVAGREVLFVPVQHTGPARGERRARDAPTAALTGPVPRICIRECHPPARIRRTAQEAALLDERA